MADLNKLANLFNKNVALEKLNGFAGAKVYQLIDGRKLFLSNPSGTTEKGTSGWTQISLSTYAKSSQNDLFVVNYEDTNDCFVFNHYLLEKVLLFVDWNYDESTSDVRTTFERSADHNGLKFRGKEGFITVHCGKSNLQKF